MSELKPQKYKDNRPPEYFQQFHERSRTKDPKFVYGLVRAALTPIALGFYRAKAIGTENVPAEGPVLLAPNHFSNMDHFFAGVYLRRQIRFMAKSQLFGPPVLTSIFTHGGVFPVRRGHRDDEAFTTVYRIFENGGAVWETPSRASAASRSNRVCRWCPSRSTDRPACATSRSSVSPRSRSSSASR